MEKEIKVIYVPKIQCWLLKEGGPDEEGRNKGVVISIVSGMSKEEQIEYFLDKILEKDKRLEVYKAILAKLTA